MTVRKIEFEAVAQKIFLMTKKILTILKALSLGLMESNMGSMTVSFLMALPGVIALGVLDMI